KTSSGKIMRYACRRAYLDGTEEPLASWTRVPKVTLPGGSSSGRPRSERSLRAWLIWWCVDRLDFDPAAIDVRHSLSSYGRGWVDAVALASDPSALLGRPWPPTVLWANPNPEALSRALAGSPHREAPRPEPQAQADAAQAALDSLLNEIEAMQDDEVEAA